MYHRLLRIEDFFLTLKTRKNVKIIVEKNIPIALQRSNGFLPTWSTRFIDIKVNPRSTVVAAIVTIDA